MLGLIGSIGQIAFGLSCVSNIFNATDNVTRAVMSKNGREESIKNAAGHVIAAVLTGAAAYACSKLQDH